MGKENREESRRRGGGQIAEVSGGGYIHISSRWTVHRGLLEFITVICPS